ncbi:hypothetical protein ASD56_06585 [Microbacterium sp. Root166]|uniref:hypothetical protein n=1 Tax=Microbacterium sp. Root166 TaxID=1736478 RepID=UPI0006FD25AC|nr:hypothetical protein [Microbacterium sp. Root166]KQZ85936.1 hypothetical protein ASD56_06585 [Microbacterium sp. Root166]
MNDSGNRATPELDPEQLRLPADRVGDHSTAHIEAALRRSGLESEIPDALPVRGGDAAAGYWGEWGDFTTSGAFGRKRVLDLDLDLGAIRWPKSLYIPRRADYREFWLTPPPDRQRYAAAWPAVGNPTRPDWANADDGSLFAYTIVPWSSPGADSRSEAGIGVRYTPEFTLGTVDFEPVVAVRDGMLTSVLDYFPTVSAGSVTLSASVVLALWQVIPGGYDLIDYSDQPIARITRDQSHGPERNRLPGALFTPRPFRKRFLVQGGREYLFGAVGRVTATSTLTDTQGRPLTGPDGSNFKVYSWVTLNFPYMTIDTATVYQA